MSEEYIVDVENMTIRFNLASEKVDNLKEYFIKLIKHELMFQEFLALKDVNLKVRVGWQVLEPDCLGFVVACQALAGEPSKTVA